jgi:Mlc titration factor MtfA (ptsG expression regulator)
LPITARTLTTNKQMIAYFRKRRRTKIRRRPFPEAWLSIIETNVPAYGRMPEATQAELLEHVLVFLEEKRFEGCGGLEITDEIVVTIAAQACVLLVSRDSAYYPRLRSILVYPDAYVTQASSWSEDGTLTEEAQHRLGESWTTGSVILSWNASKAGAASEHDGHNVVFHEFAHQLDQEDGIGDGAPLLGKKLTRTERRSMYVTWARIMQSEFDELQHQVERGKSTLIDDYGATNPAEFFAVATETFFEKPRLLRKRHPELYAELQGYYCQDPAAWKRSAVDDDEDPAGSQ